LAYGADMRAAISRQYGPPELVRVVDVAKPVAEPDEVLVRVRVATVNRTDCGYRNGHPFFARAVTGVLRPKAQVLGCEFAGVVEAVGADVDEFAVGDRVFGYSDPGFGAHADYLSVPAGGPIATIPDNVSDEAAAASTEAGHYALSIIRKGKIRSGHDVLVYGASGGIGTAAVQLLNMLGANVTAVCDHEAVPIVEQLGAQRVIDRSVEDFTAQADAYDVVIDAVGKSSFAECRPLLRARGAYLSTDLGPKAQNPFLELATKMSRGRRVALPLPLKFDKQLILEFREMLASQQFRPVLDPRTFELEEIVAAYQFVESEQKIGNVRVRVSSE
jgi:NADPH:quinone reductase-like Zn-dependent oxidoreductase